MEEWKKGGREGWGEGYMSEVSPPQVMQYLSPTQK